MKKAAVLMLTAVLLMLFCATAFGDALVTDDAGRYLSRSEIASLTEQSREIYDRYGLRVMLKITYSTPGYTSEDSLRYYANTVFNNTYSGQDGLIFVVRMSDRYCRAVTKGRGEQIFSRAILDEVEEDVLPSLSRGDYYGAFSAYLKDISGLLARYEQGERFYGSGASGLKTRKEVLVEALPVIGGVSALVTAVVMGIIVSGMKNVKKQSGASDYITDTRLTRKQDLYLYTTTTRTRIQSSSSGGGGGSGHFGGGGGGGSSSGHHF